MILVALCHKLPLISQTQTLHVGVKVILGPVGLCWRQALYCSLADAGAVIFHKRVLAQSHMIMAEVKVT